MKHFSFTSLFQIVPKDADVSILDSSIYDGDTVFGKRKPDPEIIVAKDASTRSDDVSNDGDYYRLGGVDTHETDADDEEVRQMAIEERKATAKFISDSKEEWDGDWPFVVEFKSEGAFGRPVVELYRRKDYKSLNSWLLTEKFPDRDIKYN
jgi:endonuclease YncB( thermonuclease family)